MNILGLALGEKEHIIRGYHQITIISSNSYWHTILNSNQMITSTVLKNINKQYLSTNFPIILQNNLCSSENCRNINFVDGIVDKTNSKVQEIFYT